MQNDEAPRTPSDESRTCRLTQAGCAALNCVAQRQHHSSNERTAYRGCQASRAHCPVSVPASDSWLWATLLGSQCCRCVHHLGWFLHMSLRPGCRISPAEWRRAAQRRRPGDGGAPVQGRSADPRWHRGLRGFQCDLAQLAGVGAVLSQGQIHHCTR